MAKNDSTPTSQSKSQSFDKTLPHNRFSPKVFTFLFLIVFIIPSVSGCGVNPADLINKETSDSNSEQSQDAHSTDSAVEDSSAKANAENATQVKADQAKIDEYKAEIDRLTKELAEGGGADVAKLEEDKGKLMEQLTASQDLVAKCQASLAEKPQDAPAPQAISAPCTPASRANESSLYANTEDELFWLVIRFDHAWMRYVNGNDETIFSLVKPGTALETTVRNFKARNPHMKEKVNSISLQNVEYSGDVGHVYVYEQLKHIKGGGNKIKEYNWRYRAERINGVWYLSEMKKQ